MFVRNGFMFLSSRKSLNMETWVLGYASLSLFLFPYQKREIIGDKLVNNRKRKKRSTLKNIEEWACDRVIECNHRK